MRWANFDSTVSRGFSPEQLYSTASYQAKDLPGIVLMRNDLTGWDFSGQSLINSVLSSSDLTNADFRGADLKSAYLAASTMSFILTDTETTYNQWTEFPTTIDPVLAGLKFEVSPVGDIIADGRLNIADLERLQQAIRNPMDHSTPNPAIYDVNNDSMLNTDDVQFWVESIKRTYSGDANLDGEFNSADLVDVFRVGEYEDLERMNSTWRTGDWNSDGDFDSSDVVIAFQDGGYEQGPRAAISSEPSAIVLFALAATITVSRTRRKRV